MLVAVLEFGFEFSVVYQQCHANLLHRFLVDIVATKMQRQDAGTFIQSLDEIKG
jgi:hypothetical protein